jgi:hypothetical protein
MKEKKQVYKDAEKGGKERKMDWKKEEERETKLKSNFRKSKMKEGEKVRKVRWKEEGGKKKREKT